MIKTLFIAPYQGLAETVKNLRNYDDELHIDVKVGNLEEGIQVAKAAEAEGYDLIISRGGTASQIEEQINIPVVDIKISGYDMLRVFALLKGVQGKAALVGFPNISRGASTICSILDMDVKTITISSREEVTELVSELKDEGFSVVIGDVVTVRQAERIGLQGILITSGKEAVMESFEEAKRLYHLTQKMQAQAAVYSDVIENFPQPVMMVDHDGEVVLRNRRFREQFDIKIAEEPDLQEVLKTVQTERKGIWRSASLQKEKYHVYGYPTSEDKSLVTFLLQKQFIGEEQGLKIRNSLSYIPISGETQIAKDMRENLKRYAELEEPLWIEGEPGTGRMMFACNLHFEKYGQHAPLLSFDLSVADTEVVSEFFTSKNSLLPNEATVVFENVHALEKEKHESLKILLGDLLGNFKIIIVSDHSIGTRVRNGEFDHDLFYKIPAVNVYIPPLSDRVKDIKELAQAFITQNHMKFGYEAVGIRQDALNPLINYHWPGNITQLKQTIDKLMITSNQSYIDKADVENIMEDLTREKTVSMKDGISIEGTLKDMEKQIILKVMEQEDNNQSRVAKRLGMNRTTLWRKLNS